MSNSHRNFILRHQSISINNK